MAQFVMVKALKKLENREKIRKQRNVRAGRFDAGAQTLTGALTM
jgi:hypothetical protein